MVTFAAGLDERGAYNIPINAYSYGRNGWVNSSNNFTKRLSKKPWLPDAKGFNSEVSTIYYNDQIYYFIADDGKIKYCQDNDTSWTDCGGANSITTTPGVITTFLRTNNVLLCMNGIDPLRFVDLATLDVTVFTYVADPSNAPTMGTPGGITTSGSYRVYYGITWNSDGGGETAISPILSQAVSKSRSTWDPDGTEYLTVNRNNTAPAGATSWNLYAAQAIQGTVPQATDLYMLQANIPTATTSFVDNGSVPFDISYNSAPKENSTEGIKASTGTVAGNVPVLYGDPDNPYTLYFGGIVDTGVSFGSNNGAQRLPLLEGTNFYPTSVIGFRNNQGIPSLLALFSSTDGVSRQQTVSKKTITYGSGVLSYWDGEELNSGASAVYSQFGVVNHLGRLLFPSSEGITSINTEAQMQNVLSTSLVSDQITPTYKTIKNASFDKIVSTAWSNYVFFIVPSRGYNYNNQIIIYDLTNKDNPKWAIWDIAADWIGTVSPPNRDSFVYIRDGKRIMKLAESYVAEDEVDGTSKPFPVEIAGSLVPFNQARNSYYAINQAVFYVANWIGEIKIEVSYINQKGKTKRKTKTFVNGSSERGQLAGWSNPRNLYRSFCNRVINWSTPIPMSGESVSMHKVTKRLRVKLPNPVVNEVKFRVYSDLENTSFDLVNVTFEGVNIGVIGDIV